MGFSYFEPDSRCHFRRRDSRVIERVVDFLRKDDPDVCYEDYLKAKEEVEEAKEEEQW